MTAHRSAAVPGSDEPRSSRRDRIVEIEFDEPRPEWMHPDSADALLALEEGACCKYPAEALVSRAQELAEAIDRTLTTFDGGNSDCAQTARELILLMASLPTLVAEICSGIPAANRVTAAQLLCPVGRLILLILELAGRSGCPMACDTHGAPDRRPAVALLVPALEMCDEVLWAAVLPRVPRRSSAGPSACA